MMEIIECEQNSPEWYAARAGIPTASEFEAILTQPKSKGGVARTRQTYMLKLAGELLTDEPMEQITTRHMERGKIMEDEARDLYSFMTDVEPQRVGFIKNFGAGASPDSLIGDRGGLEIKSALPHIQIERLLVGELPDEHKAQVYGCMWIAERDWWDFISYCPKLPLFVKRVHRDEEYIAKLAGAVAKFNLDLGAAVETIRNYGAEKAVA
jgi:hypothetical protein